MVSWSDRINSTQHKKQIQSYYKECIVYKCMTMLPKLQLHTIFTGKLLIPVHVRAHLPMEATWHLQLTPRLRPPACPFTPPDQCVEISHDCFFTSSSLSRIRIRIQGRHVNTKIADDPTQMQRPSSQLRNTREAFAQGEMVLRMHFCFSKLQPQPTSATPLYRFHHVSRRRVG